jgi:hypothetical protein
MQDRGFGESDWQRSGLRTPGSAISGLFFADDNADDEIDGGNKDEADQDANGVCHGAVPASRVTF